MTNINKASKYSDNYILKQVVDFLEQDGAICNYYAKYYKENETFNGGTGDRLAFKNYNDKIIKYQSILKVLTGEQKANIYERIPAIDFLDPEYTNFMYTYPKIEDANGVVKEVDNNKIIPITVDDSKTAEELIEDEDEYTINRALAGYDTAEYFYGTSGLMSSNYDLQVAAYTQDENSCKYIYKGLIMPKNMQNGVVVENNVRETDLLVFKCSNDMQLYFTDEDPQNEAVLDENNYIIDIIPASETFLKSNKDVIEDSRNNSFITTKNKILNVDCVTDGVADSGWTPYGYNKNTKEYGFFNVIGVTYNKGIKHNAEDDNTIVEAVTPDTVEYKYQGHYLLNLSEGDVIYAIPSTAYSTDSTKLLILKSNEVLTETEDGGTERTLNTKDVTFSYVEAYYNETNRMFYADENNTIAILPSDSVVYYAPKGVTVTADSIYYYNKYGTVYEKVDNIKSVNTEAKTFVRTVSDDRYTCYVLYMKGFQKDISISGMFSSIKVGDNVYDMVKDDTFDILKDYISIEVKYIAKAPGLLAGYFSKPYAYETQMGSKSVSEWEFINEREDALSMNVAIDIGAKYFSGHLLTRGDIIESPLKLTSKDSLDGVSYKDLPSKKGIYGKATLIYDKLMTDRTNLYDMIFSSYKSFSWGNQVPKEIFSIVTKDDYKSLYYGVKLKVKDRNNAVIDYADIQTYVTNFARIFSDSTLVLNSNDDFVMMSSTVRKRNNPGWFRKVTTSYDRNSQDIFDDNSTRLCEEIKQGVLFDYENYTYNDSCGNDHSTSFNKIFIDFITPYKLFAGDKTNDGVIVVLPEEKKYFPEQSFIFSKSDLGLTTSGSNQICTLFKDNKMLIFKVNKVTAIKPSKIDTFRITDGDDTSTLSLDRVAKAYVSYVFDMNLSSIESLITSEPTEGTSTVETVYVHNGEKLVPQQRYVTRYEYNKYTKTYKNFLSRFSGESDCYIYELTYLNCPSTLDFKIYDADDNPIGISETSSYNKLCPFYYTSSDNSEDKKLFTIKNHNNGHLLSALHRDDYKQFIGGAVICGVPNYSYTFSSNIRTWLPQSISSYSKDLSAFQSTFISLLTSFDNSKSEIIKNLILDSLYNWKISTSDINPITIMQLPLILEGLIEFGNDIRDISESGFTVSSNGKLITLNKESFEGLLNIIEYSKQIKRYNINVTEPDLITSITEDISEYDATQLKDFYNKKVQELLKGIKIELVAVDSSEYSTKASIKQINDALKAFINPDLSASEQESLTRTSCEVLDRYLGNNTAAFLAIGEDQNSRNIRIEDTPQLQKAKSDIITAVSKIVANVAQQIKNKKNSSNLVNVLEEHRNRYKNYYTDESVNSNITLSPDGASISVNLSGLIPKKERREEIIQAQYTAESYQLFKGSFFNFLKYLFGGGRHNTSNLLRRNSAYYESWYNSNISGGSNATVIGYYNSNLRFIRAQYEKELKESLGTDNESTFNYDTVKDYITNNGSQTSPVAVAFVSTGGTTNNRIRLNVTPPKVAFTLDTNKRVSNLTLEQAVFNAGNDNPWGKSYTFNNVFSKELDVTRETLWGLVDFVKTALNGASTDATITYAVRNIGGQDSEPTGRDTSLYYKRYQMLNNRMNRLQGNLWNATMLLRNSQVIKDIKRLSSQTYDSYEPYIDIMPIQSMEALTYMPTQPALMSKDIINGKFYSDKELEEMRKLINERCVLTCTKCLIKDSCPFYSQEEVVKLYCTGIETIDIWVKDNKLDLLAYEEDINNEGHYILPKITSDSDEGVDVSKFINVHIPYSEIEQKTNADGTVHNFVINNLDTVRENLENEPKLQYSKYVKDDMGWLLGARYGTVQKNNITSLVDANDELLQYKDKIHPYKYMYDAVFIEDEETYVNYTPSNNIYKTEFEIKSNGKTNHYDVETKIQIPSSLKIFANNSLNDDVYLISDDTTDANGETIIPLIYLGKIKDLEYVFDLRDDGIQGGVKDPEDTKLYAADVAQWCVNYYKGNCYKNPLNETQSNIPDLCTNHDQYWMESVYKKISKDGENKWYKFNGRKRELSGYSTPLIDENNYDEVQAISGRPIIADYINFLRKVSIRIYNRETGQWTIPWINENLKFLYEDKYFKGLDTLEKKCEKQRTVLPLMKTNLRIAIVKN